MIAVIGERAPNQTKAALRRLGYRVLSLPSFTAALDTPVCDHADMLLCSDSHRLFYPAAYEKNATDVLCELAARTGLSLAPLPEGERLSPEYPNDVKLNALRVGDHLLCHRAISPTLQQAALEQGLTVTFVRQGYARCSTAPVSDDAIITADPCIADAAERLGIHVLRICPGHITLPPYDYGFIGGASGYDAERHVLFLCGDASAHPDIQNGRIQAFCRTHKADLLSLPPDTLCDVGGIQFYSEKQP